MAKLSIKAGATSQSVNVFVRDSSSTIGAGLAAVAPAGGSLLTGTKLYYSFTGTNASAGVAVSLSVLAAVNSAWSSAGIVTLDATNMIGWVRIDLPDAALVTAKGRVVSFHLYGGTNMAPTPFEVELTGWDNQDAVHGGLTCLPNTAVTSNASLLTSGSSTDQLLVSSGKVVTPDTQKVDLNTIKGQAVTCAAGVTVLASVGTATTDTAQTGDSYAIVNHITYGNAQLVRSTTPANTLDVSATGEAGLDFNNIKDATGAHTLTNIRVPNVTLTDTVTTYTSNTPQTGDSFARIGLAGAGLTALGDTRIANLDATVTSRMATYTQPTGFLAATFPNGTLANQTNITAGTITTVTNVTTVNGLSAAALAGFFTTDTTKVYADAVTGSVVKEIASNAGSSASTTAQAVWDLATSGHTTSGTFGAAMIAAGATGDPWATSLPGSYGFGTAGFILGINLDSQVSNIQADTNDIQNRLPTALDGSGNILANVQTFDGNAPVQTLGKLWVLDGSGNAVAPASDTTTIIAKTNLIPVSPAAVGSAMTLTSGERNSIAAALLALADGVETGVTVKQTLRLLAAGVAGKRSNCGTTSEQYDAVGSPGTARIVGNLNSSGDGTPTLTP